MLNTEHQTLSAQLEEHLAKLRSTASVFSTMCEHGAGVLTPDALRETAQAMDVVSRLAYDTAKALHNALEAQQPTTADGVRVSPGDTVWVIGSVDVHEARVRPLDALTDYYLFGLLPVSGAYSTEKAALRARHIGQLAGKAGA